MLWSFTVQESQDDLLIVDEPPSWSDDDDSLELMSELDEEENMPEYKDSSPLGVGDL